MSCDLWKSHPGTTKIIQSQAYAGLLVTNTQKLAPVCFRQTTSHPGSNRSPGKSIRETFSSACTLDHLVVLLVRFLEGLPLKQKTPPKHAGDLCFGEVT